MCTRMFRNLFQIISEVGSGKSLAGNIGIVGIIVVLIGLFIAIRKDIKVNFIYLMVTSILTTTAVITIGDNSITIPHIIALIFSLKIIYEIHVGHIKFYLIKNTILYYLLFCIVSIPVGIIFSKIMNINIQYSVISILIQIIYLIMCICIFYFVRIAHLNGKISFKDFHIGLIITTMELFVLSCFQLINTQIFNYLFVNRAGHAFIQTLENGQQRITAAFNEPSMLAIYLALALIYFTFMSFSHRKNLILVIICLFIGLISRGSSFILATILGFIISGIILMRRTTKKQLIIIITSIILGILLVNFLSNNLIFNEIINLTNKVLGKGTSGSQRLLNFKQSISYFTKSPLFGLGYGAIRSTDWGTTLLANTGIIGFVLLGVFFLPVLLFSKEDSMQLKGVKISTCVALFLLIISVPEPYFNFMWIFIAFSIVKDPIYDREIENVKIFLKR